MEPENNPSAPTGFILIATYWIFFGVLLLSTISGSLSSRYFNPFPFIFLLISIGLILVGWGLLTMKRWAYRTTLVLSIIGVISLFYIGPISISMLFNRYYSFGITTILLFASFLYIPMLWYLLKKGNMFKTKQGGKPDRICPQCGRSIPFDALCCPYCKHNFQTFL